MRNLAIISLFVTSVLASSASSSQENTFSLVCSNPKGESKYVTVSESKVASNNWVDFEGKRELPLIDKDRIHFSTSDPKIFTTYDINRTTGIMHMVVLENKTASIISEASFRCQKSNPKF